MMPRLSREVMTNSKMQRIRLAVAILLFMIAYPAFAYIDPNTGGYLFQLLAPLVALAMSAWMFFAKQVRSVWQAFVSLFTRTTGKPSASPREESEKEDKW